MSEIHEGQGAPQPEEFRLFGEAMNTIPKPQNANLDSEIDFWEQVRAAWDSHLGGSPYHLQALGLLLPILLNCARLYFQRFQKTQQLDDLERALQMCQEAYQASPKDSPELPAIRNNLLLMLNVLLELLSRQYNRRKDLAILRHCLQLCEQALELITDDPPQRARYLSQAGQVSKELYLRTHEREQLEHAINWLNQAVEAAPADAQSRYASLETLGYVYRERYTLTHNLADLELALERWLTAIHTTAQAPTLPQLMTTLSEAMVAYFQRTRKLADLERFVTFWKEAVAGLSEDAPELPERLNFLGYGLSQRYELQDQDTDLEQAIQLFERAVALSHSLPLKQTASLNNLGNALHLRYAASGSLSDLERALQTYEQALALPLVDPSEKLASYCNLLTVLKDRYRVGNDLSYLNRAIALGQEALALDTSTSHQGVSRCAGLLSDLLRERYIHSHDKQDLKLALVFEKEWGV